MAMKPLDPRVVDESQTEMKESLSGSVVPEVNVDAVKKLGTARTFEFPEHSGILYDVPRVPYKVGLEINDLWIRLREHGKHPEGRGVPQIYKRLLDDVVKVSWEKLVIPRSRIRRLRKRMGWLKNPLRHMAEADLAELVGFFLARRMAATVQFRFPATQEQKMESESQ